MSYKLEYNGLTTSSIDRKYNEECRLHYSCLERKIHTLEDVINSLQELSN